MVAATVICKWKRKRLVMYEIGFLFLTLISWGGCNGTPDLMKGEPKQQLGGAATGTSLLATCQSPPLVLQTPKLLQFIYCLDLYSQPSHMYL